MAEDGEIEPDALPAIEREVDEEIERAVAFAEASAEESVATLLRHAYAEPEEVSS
jgi:TPP-dependent pyruvate/acetoin dehydrogenase alpha subunit